MLNELWFNLPELDDDFLDETPDYILRRIDVDWKERVIDTKGVDMSTKALKRKARRKLAARAEGHTAPRPSKSKPAPWHAGVSWGGKLCRE
jgi:hypothetical protein